MQLLGYYVLTATPFSEEAGTSWHSITPINLVLRKHTVQPTHLANLPFFKITFSSFLPPPRLAHSTLSVFWCGRHGAEEESQRGEERRFSAETAAFCKQLQLQRNTPEASHHSLFPPLSPLLSVFFAPRKKRRARNKRRSGGAAFCFCRRRRRMQHNKSSTPTISRAMRPPSYSAAFGGFL